MGLAGVGWRDGEKMQTIVTEYKKKNSGSLDVRDTVLLRSIFPDPM